MAKMKMKVDVNVLELDVVSELIEVLRDNLSDLPSPVVDVLERVVNKPVVNKPVEYDVDYFNDRGLYDLKVFVDGEPHLDVVAVSPEGKYIKQYVDDDLGNYVIVDECIQTEIVHCFSLELRDSKGNPVAKELWW